MGRGSDMDRGQRSRRIDLTAVPDLTLDIAVIGAGVSGAYSACRLKGADLQKRIALFEWSNRIGGRLYSRVLPGMPHLRAELGGMRFLPEQKMVANLIHHLKLETRPFPMGANSPDGQDNNIMYLRGRLLRVRDLRDWTKVPYNVRAIERNRNPDELQNYVRHYLFPDADSYTLENWYNATVFNGDELYMWGFWNLLYRVLSSEAYHFMSDGGGYYTNAADSNAAASLHRDEFSQPSDYLALALGYDELPKKLVDQFKSDNGDYYDNCRLAAIARAPAAPYVLEFVRTHLKDEVTCDKSPEEVLRVHADKIILAMPRKSLEGIDWPPLTENMRLSDDLRAVVAQPAIKIFFGYDYPWWRALGLEAGRSITDMPIRQVYYFGTEGDEKGADPKNRNSLMMVSYNDAGAVPFWKAFECLPDFQGRENAFVSKGSPRVLPHPDPISLAMVRSAQQQVAEVHGINFVPKPYTAIYQDWTAEPFGGGWHAWKAGFKFWEIVPRMRKPVDGEDVFICGEAYSNYQGWVEGALQTAELMLEDHFGLARPDWLPADYHLGP
jgi:monoamine oxidase